MADQMPIQFEPPREDRRIHQIISKWSDEDLQRNLAIYERLVRVHSGKALPTLNRITKKLVSPEPMPWMLPAYESGLAMIKQEINRRKEVANG